MNYNMNYITTLIKISKQTNKIQLKLIFFYYIVNFKRKHIILY